MLQNIIPFICLLLLAVHTSSCSCDVPNCETCSSENICGECSTNYLLTIDHQTQVFTCQLVECPDNCNKCYQDNVCQTCNDQFFITSNGTCSSLKTGDSKLSQHCLWGLNSQNCTLCKYGYRLDQGECHQAIPIVDDLLCLVKQTDKNCQICSPGFMVNFNGKCIQKEKEREKLRILTVTNDTTNYTTNYTANYTTNYTNVTNGNYSNCTLQNCQTCINATYCQACIQKYAPNPGNVCILCDITGCKICSSQNICIVCNLKYQLTLDNICLLCDINNCTQCSEINICETCVSPLIPSSTGGDCLICDKTLQNMIKCLTCNTQNSCGVCSNGYQLFVALDGKGICINCSIPNCQACSLVGNSVSCKKCMTGYNSIGASCVQCFYPCATCTSNRSPNNCATCQTPSFFNTALSNGTCVKNLIPHCINFTISNQSKCSNCQTGFYLNTTSNICLFICSNFCKNCNSTSCIQCQQGYIMTVNKTCIKCQVKSCYTCANNGSTCLTCLKGFYINSGECLVCPGYCSSCTSGGTCTGLVSSNNRVLIVIWFVVYLAYCQSNCITCSNINPSKCLQCMSGHYLQNGRCFRCQGNCYSCDSFNKSKCFSCYSNYWLVQNKCTKCSPNCLSCAGVNDLQRCISCRPGYYVSNNDCIASCSLNCYTCSNSTTCTQCLSGYTLYPSHSEIICAPCTTSCRTCAYGRPSICLQCGQGFYLFGTTCIQCSFNCQSCSPAGCYQCIQGYFLTSLQTCAQACDLPCATCLSSNSLKYTICIAGYQLNIFQNSCYQIVSCLGGCRVCPMGWTLKNGRCYPCNVLNCRSCNPVNTNECYSCKPKYYLTSWNTCQPCNKTCTSCLSSTGCLTCAKGYTITNYLPATADLYQCAACLFPCATCTYTPGYCTSCVSGFTFIGWKCAQIFFFVFRITLKTSIDNFHENYYAFLLIIVIVIGGSNINAVSIFGISFGSVILDGGAGPSGQSGSVQAGYQLGALISLLQSNELLGMQVSDSSVTVTNGEATAYYTSGDSEDNKYIIVLAVVIPTVVICNFTLLFSGNRFNIVCFYQTRGSATINPVEQTKKQQKAKIKEEDITSQTVMF